MNTDRSFKYALFILFLMSLSLTIPLIFLNAPWWVLSIVTLAVFATALSGSELIALVYRLIHNIVLRPGLYIWALVITINGPQDFLAIAFYIIAGLQALSIIKNFLGEIFILFSFLNR